MSVPGRGLLVAPVHPACRRAHCGYPGHTWPAAWSWTQIRLGAPGREGDASLSYFLAVLAACANATSSVLQRKANKEIPHKENLS